MCSKVAEILTPITPNRHVNYVCRALDAELIKFMENAFLATKVAFVNEFYDLVGKIRGSWTSVREEWLLDPRVGRSHSTVFSEDRGFGGRCPPKDVAAILEVASELNISLDVQAGASKANARLKGESK